MHQDVTHLDIGRTAVAVIYSKAKWNVTDLKMYKGETYRFEASGRWYDASIPSGPAGYGSPSIVFRLVEWLRRVSRANWFALIGTIGQNTSAAFVIGERGEIRVSEDGILYCFANDLPFMYGNNSGWIELTVTRVA